MKKFLNRVIPFKYESLFNYLMRLIVINYYKPSWIYDFLGANNITVNQPYVNFIDVDQIATLSKVSGIKKGKLYNLTFNKFSSYFSHEKNLNYDDRNRPYFKNGRVIAPHIKIINSKF